MNDEIREETLQWINERLDITKFQPQFNRINLYDNAPMNTCYPLRNQYWISTFLERSPVENYLSVK